jgi:hypothetical protein
MLSNFIVLGLAITATAENALLGRQAVPAGCSVIETLAANCAGATAGFTALALSQQASCLCYSGTSWVSYCLGQCGLDLC